MNISIFNRLAVVAAFFLAITPAALFAGPDQDLGDFNIFPDDNVWKWDISNYQVHPNSGSYLASVGVAAAKPQLRPFRARSLAAA